MTNAGFKGLNAILICVMRTKRLNFFCFHNLRNNLKLNGNNLCS